jgi:hypothetical protein
MPIAIIRQEVEKDTGRVHRFLLTHGETLQQGEDSHEGQGEDEGNARRDTRLAHTQPVRSGKPSASLLRRHRSASPGDGNHIFPARGVKDG